MRILLTGQNGQVGWELARSLLPLGSVITLDRHQLDMMHPETCRAIIQQHKPEVIVNAAAYTNVDLAEDEIELANTINATATGILAEEARKVNALLIHYSTDYVFDGTKSTAYAEDDVTNPINAYGRSKLSGEQAIQKTGADHLIFRTSWVYSARRTNFLLSMLKLMKTRETLRIVNDQTGAPTWSRSIADITAHVIKQAWTERHQGRFKSGIFNLSGSGNTTWYEFAKRIAELAKADAQFKQSLMIRSIEPITTAEYPSKAKRPLNSKMSHEKIVNRFNVVMPDWQECLRLCMQDVV